MKVGSTALSIGLFICCCLGVDAYGQGAICPLQPGEILCTQLQSQFCQTTLPNNTCRPKTVIFDPSIPGGLRAIDCTCYPPDACGPVTINGNIASCTGFCPVPPSGNTCQVFVNGAPTGLTSINYTTLAAGSQIACECAPIGVQVCGPIPTGTACKDVTCPNTADRCLPTCIIVGPQGQIAVQGCNCRSPNTCHIEAVAGAPPQCVGGCPAGFTCMQRVTPTPTGVEYCCECVQDPPFCEPTSDGSACTNFLCPGPVPPSETCRPRCIRWNPPTGQYTILECDCRGQNECHVEFTPGTVPSCQGGCPPGQNCTRNLIQHADGTVTVCCDCAAQGCECPGDVDGNGILNALDIAGFIRCFLGNPLPTDNCACVDINGDGSYTTADVNAFVVLILTKAVCPNTPCCPKMDLVQSLATGTDANGLIPVGNDDDEWVVTLDPNGGTVPRPATVVTPHPSWFTFPGTQWVSANYFGINGDYEYRFCFCLDDRYSNPLLSLRVRADDFGQVFLNGNFIGNCAGFGDPNPPVISTSNPAFFMAGQNCVTVRVQNVGGAPTGLNMIGTVSARNGKCCCPPKDLSKTPDSGVYDNSGGTLIPFGNNDDTWTVIAPDPSGGSTPRPATVITPNGAWATIPGTRWVSAAQYGPNGTYHYEYCFCLDPRFKNPMLVIDLLADDRARVFLNGNPIGATPLSYAFLNPPTHIVVTNPTLFEACENCIEIEVDNTHGVVTGFDIKATITADDGLCCDDRPLSCCLPGGNCIDLAPGTMACPDGSTPVDGPCGNLSACCLPGGGCQMLFPACCEAQGGGVLPAGTMCTGQLRPCCVDTPVGITCTMVDPVCCTQILNGVPNLTATSCVDSNGDAIPDACQPPHEQCTVDPLTNRCRQTVCPIAGQQCLPRCAIVAAGTTLVLGVQECDCMNPTDCHIQISPAPSTASCAGICPPGFICQTIFTDLGNGTQSMCCQCVPNPNLCPLNASLGSQLCQARQPADCVTTPPATTVCQPTIVITNGAGQGITVEHCACRGTSGPCGTIDIQPAATMGDYILRCLGTCPPMSGCNIYINGSPAGVSQINTASQPPGQTITCGCFIP